jgi:hypothetical protein
LDYGAKDLARRRELLLLLLPLDRSLLEVIVCLAPVDPTGCRIAAMPLWVGVEFWSRLVSARKKNKRQSRLKTKTTADNGNNKRLTQKGDWRIVVALALDADELRRERHRGILEKDVMDGQVVSNFVRG